MADVPAVVIVEYSQLIDPSIDLDSLIDQSFGANSLGLICVKNVPNYSEARRRLLPLSYEFASFNQSIKQSFEDPESMYSFGWSHGKEQMKSGRPDFAKGSYYNNPIHDDPFNVKDKSINQSINQSTEQSTDQSINQSINQSIDQSNNQSIDKLLPTFARPNIWPGGLLPDFEPAFKSLGSIIVNTGAQLAVHIDRFVHRRLNSYPINHLTNIIQTSKTHKARLLHYFQINQSINQSVNQSHDQSISQPINQSINQSDSQSDVDSWCGFHNDHSSLTGLTAAMYINNQSINQSVDQSTNESINQSTNQSINQSVNQSINQSDSPPDNQSGLLIQLRNQSIISLSNIDPDLLIFQLGETQMIHSGGIVQATPHAVRAPNQSITQSNNQSDNQSINQSISREAFAVFMGPPPDHHMRVPVGVNDSDLLTASALVNLPSSVPQLATRWNQSMDFATFGERTMAAYLVQ